MSALESRSGLRLQTVAYTGQVHVLVARPSIVNEKRGVATSDPLTNFFQVDTSVLQQRLWSYLFKYADQPGKEGAPLTLACFVSSGR